ncbi:MAG: winged helix-turn-helix transcriptional regulator [Magnetococcales bacterium]|nr:winged helix-turn-helix transcriptional regulator [Magnetococcales bacterium]
MSKEFGGTSLIIPKKLDRDHHLLAVIGEKATKALIREYSGDTLSIPKLNMLKAKLRDIQLLQDRESGVSPKELARKYNLTERHVWRILKKLLKR